MLNGITDLNNNFPFVGSYGCSAVAISPHIVLSAEHCLFNNAYNCGVWSPLTITFPQLGGETTSPGAITTTALAIRHHPSLFDASKCPTPATLCTDQAVSCEQTLCPTEAPAIPAGLYKTQTERGDMFAMFVDPPLPASAVGKVIVHKDFADPGKGLIADPGLASWVQAKQPNTTIIGFGTNNATPGVTRAFGLLRWVDTQYESLYGGWKGCTSYLKDGPGPMIVLDAKGFTFPNIPDGGPLDCDLWPPGTNFPDSGGYAMIGRGDSGGAVVIGGLTSAPGGLAPTPPLFPQSGLNPGEPHVIGIASSGGCATSYYAPTYTAETSAWIADLLKDTDSDGTPDPFDLCNGGSNLDSDGDGTPDDCDPCPLEPGGVAGSLGDDDKDLVCNADDLCDLVYDPAQLNSNDESEQAQLAASVGDRCEPVPVPNFFAQPKVTEQKCTPFSATQDECITTLKLAVQDNIEADFQGSHDATGTFNQNTFVPTTQTRFCWNKNVAGTINCANNNAAIRDNFALPQLIDEVLESPFHRITLDGQPRSYSAVPGRFYPGFPALNETLTWGYGPDLSFWASKGYPNAAPSVDYTPRVGRLWMHADTDIGMGTDVGTGLHFKLNGNLGQQLANHYQLVYPSTTTKLLVPSDNSFIDIDIFPPCWGGECMAGGVLPHDDCLACDLTNPGDIVTFPGEGRLVADLPGRGLHYLAEGGGFAPLPPQALSEAVRGLLQGSVSRVAAAEPTRGYGYGTSVPSMLAMAADGVTVLGGITVLGGRAVTTTEARLALLGTRGGAAAAPAEIPGFRNPEAVPQFIPAAQGSPVPTARPGVASTAIYSASLGKLFVLRGRSKASDPPGDLWVRSVRDASGYRAITLDKELGRVVSATFTQRGRKLWVLDEKQGKWGMGQTRLLSIDPVSGQVLIAASWPKFGVFDRRWLLTDRDGHLLLASSSSALKKHVIVRLEAGAEAQPKVTTVLWRQGDLGRAPVVEQAGYRFFVRGTKKKEPRLRVERVRELPVKPHGWDEVGSCL